MVGINIKKVIIYGQMTEEFDSKIEEMKEFIDEQNWILVEGLVDDEGSFEGLLNLSEKLQEIDIIVIYDKKNIVDIFNLEFLFQVANNEDVEVVEYN